ncbi:MAG: amidohydrolase family protein [Chloroflexota bacterium]
MEIIDAHQHFWKPELFDILKLEPGMEVLSQYHDPQELRPQLDAAGVSRTVLVQTYSSLGNNREFLAAADQNDWVAAVVGWVDLADPAVGQTLDELQRHPKFKGARHQWHDEPDPAWQVRDDVLRGLRELAKRRIPYELLVMQPNWEYIPRVAEAVPDLSLAVDHIAKPAIAEGQWGEWVAAMARAASFPQMYCKLSGMVTLADWQRWKPDDLRPYVDKVIELFGVDRVMFGSDWPVCLLAATYGQVFDAFQVCIGGLSEAEKTKVLGENAKRFYGLA